MTDAYLGYEDIGADGYLQPTRYKIRALCGRCQKEFSWIAKTPGGPDRPCPRAACKAAALEAEIEARALKLAKMLDEQRGPAQIGHRPMVHAIDTTAEIVMKDHGLTDLKDNIRQGEAMVPSLKGKSAGGTPLQGAVDNFFQSSSPKGLNRAMAARLNNRVARVMHGGGIRVHPSVMAPNARAGDPAITHVRTDKNSGAGPNAR